MPTNPDDDADVRFLTRSSTEERVVATRSFRPMQIVCHFPVAAALVLGGEHDLPMLLRHTLQPMFCILQKWVDHTLPDEAFEQLNLWIDSGFDDKTLPSVRPDCFHWFDSASNATYMVVADNYRPTKLPSVAHLIHDGVANKIRPGISKHNQDEYTTESLRHANVELWAYRNGLVVAVALKDIAKGEELFAKRGYATYEETYARILKKGGFTGCEQSLLLYSLAEQGFSAPILLAESGNDSHAEEVRNRVETKWPAIVHEAREHVALCETSSERD
jgi:hypothetical protein